MKKNKSPSQKDSIPKAENACDSAEKNPLETYLPGVVPLKSSGRAHLAPLRKKTDCLTAKKRREQASTQLMQPIAETYVPTTKAISPDAIVSYLKDNHDIKILKQLQKNMPAFQKTLDLHGLTEQVALARLNFFLQYLPIDCRVVRIIHGKGRDSEKAILKTSIDHYLRQQSAVLAFCSCQAQHGGAGAIYVRLTRKTD